MNALSSFRALEALLGTAGARKTYDSFFGSCREMLELAGRATSPDIVRSYSHSIRLSADALGLQPIADQARAVEISAIGEGGDVTTELERLCEIILFFEAETLHPGASI